MKYILISLVLLFSILGLNAQKVGIGVSIPNMNLHVNSQADTAVLQLDNNTSLANNINVGMYFKTGNWFTGALKTIGTGVNTARVGLFSYAALNQNGLKERLSILDNGNVGINNTNPQATLDINGSLKISGGNTNPSDGAVLVSDANGIASWRKSKIAFDVKAVEPANLSLSNGLGYNNKIHFLTKNYDYGNSYIKKTADSSDGGSYFVVPVTGIYHFDITLTFEHGTVDWVQYQLGIYVNSSSIPFPVIKETYHTISTSGYSETANLSTDVRLTAGQKICIALSQVNPQNASLNLVSNHTFFNCHLIFPD